MQDVLQGQRIASLSDNLPYHYWLALVGKNARCTTRANDCLILT